MSFVNFALDALSRLTIVAIELPPLPDLSQLGTEDFFRATQWGLILAGLFALLTVLAFLLQWGFRFRLVGVTSFTLVLTAGCFALSIVPFTPTTIPGAAHYSLTFDNGGSHLTIAFIDPVTPEEVSATLKQVAINQGSYGRTGKELEVQARTIVHPQPGVSQALYLGRAIRPLAGQGGAKAADLVDTIQVELNPKAFAVRDRLLANS